MPRVNQKLPISLATAVAQASVPYERSGFAADYAIGNLPWIAANSDKYEYNRSTTSYQRDRVDQGSSAGENSLTNWWLRAATSWHRGAGINYYDAKDSDIYRFNSSWNVDVWTEGQASLLPKTSLVYDDEVTFLHNSTNGVFFIADAGLVHFFNGTTATHVTTLASEGVATCLCVDGATAYVGTTKGVYSVTEGGTVTKLYHAGSTSGTWTAQTIAFLKERLIVCVEASSTKYILQLATNPASPPTAVNFSTDSIYTSNSTSLVFNSICETSSAILVGVTSGQSSRVLAFTIDTQATAVGGLPALTDAITVAKLPTGETINVMRDYLNTYVLMGTSSGLRVGIDTGGVGFSYGPLTIRSTIKDITFYNGFAYATRADNLAPDGSDSKGLWRINLGETTNTSTSYIQYSLTARSTYAYASDLTVVSGTPSSVAVLGATGKLITGTNTGLHLESSTSLSDSGYISSGKIRYGTTENKQVVSLSSTVSGAGSFGIVVDSKNGYRASYETIGISDSTELSLSSQIFPDEYFEITITLNKHTATGVADTSPVLEQWQLRSLPAPQRSRTITFSVLCYDEETDSYGQIKTDSAYDRLKTLEVLENSGSIVLFQDFSTGEQRYCVVRAVQYVQTSPPTALHGFGGIVTIQLQTVDKE